MEQRREPITSWRDLQNWYYSELRTSTTRRWLFRGQRCWEWQLTTKLERVAGRFGVSLKKLPLIEKELCEEFQRHYHRYANKVPDKKDTIRWLTLMQHYGAPTRLLDWTYSFYVGVFFPIEHAEPCHECALWILDNDWYWKRAKQKLPNRIRQMIDRDPERGKSLGTYQAVMAHKKPLVVPSNPWELDERLAVQQGVSLMPLDLTRSFEKNLSTSATEVDTSDKFFRLKLCVNKTFFTEAISELQRMNITRLSLFPGLDGLAHSLENLPAMPHRFLDKDDLS